MNNLTNNRFGRRNALSTPKNNFIRKKDLLSWFFILALLFTGLPAVLAQHNLVFYNMQQVPQSNLLNPGRIPMVKSYVGIPVLSGIRVGAGNTGFSFDEFDMSNMNDAYDFQYAGLRKYLKSGTNRVHTDNEVRLLSYGTRLWDGFINVDIGEVAFASGTYTPEILTMFDDVQQGVLSSSGMDTTYNQSRHELNGAYYRSYSVSYARQVLPNLSLGGRFRFLQGKAAVRTENQGLMLQYPGEGSYFQVLGRMNLMSAGLENLSDHEASYFLFKGGNIGYAFDFGGVYQVNDKIEFSFSAVNLGRISWKKNTNYQVVADHLQFSAVDIEEHMDLWGEVADSLVHGMPVDTNVRFHTTLPQRYYLGGNYYLCDDSSVGFLVNPVRLNGVTDVAFAISGNTRIGENLGVSAAVAYHRYAPFNLGLGLSYDLGIVQFYAATDNLISNFNWKGNNTVQTQFGINLNFGAMRRGESSTKDEDVALTFEERLLQGELPSPATEDEESYKPEPEFLNRPDYPEKPGAPVSVGATNPAASSPPADPRSFTLSGTARDVENGDILTGISVEVYQFNENGQRDLVYTGSFYNGRLSVPLRRGYSHQVIVNRAGYDPKVLLLEANRISASEAEVMRDFALRKAPSAMPETTAPGANVPSPKDNPEISTSPSDLPSPNAEGVEAQEASAPGLGTYYLTDKTSLRRGPHHTTGVILRFDEGDRVEVLEKTNEWWWKARFRGRIGYVKAHLLVR